MATSYPTGIDAFTAQIDDKPSLGIEGTYVVADDVNHIQDSIVAVEQTLGVNPQGTYTSVAERLEAIGDGGGGTPTNHLHDGSDGTQPLDPTKALLPNSFKPNLLTNSGFRLGDRIGWTGIGANGFAAPNIVTTRGTETGLQKTGSNTSGVDQEVVSDQALSINVAGTKLVLSGYISTPNVTAGAFKLRLVAHDASEVELLGSEVSAVNGVTDRYYTTLTIPTGANHVHVKCIVANGTTFAGGGCRFNRLKLEEDSGSGKPSPYSDEADISYLAVNTGGTAEYAPINHTHGLATYDVTTLDTPGFIAGIERDKLLTATDWAYPGRLVQRDDVGGAAFNGIKLWDGTVVATPANPEDAAPKKYVDALALVEEGSNIYGFYRKYPSGYMECWGSATATALSANNYIEFPITFPYAFTTQSPQYFNGSMNDNVNGRATILYRATVTSGAQGSLWFSNLGAAWGANYAATCRWEAKGRWR